MSVCIALRDDYDGIQLRDLAKASRDPRQVRRLLALAAAYDGMSRAEAACRRSRNPRACSRGTPPTAAPT